MFQKNLNLLRSWVKPKVAIYARVSTQGQADKGYGIEAQINMCKRTCEMKNFDIYKIYIDAGVSGATKSYERPELSKLLEDGKNKLFDTMILYSIDRLSRSIRVALNIIDNLRDNNIKLVFCKECIDTNTEHGDFMFNIFASVSDHELNVIRRRLYNGYLLRKNCDGDIGGKLPYGYARINNKISINPIQAQVVRSIFRSYYINKLSMNKIANILTKEGIETPGKGAKWYDKTIKLILNNKSKYEGGLVNDNKNNVRWPIILEWIFPELE